MDKRELTTLVVGRSIRGSHLFFFLILFCFNTFLKRGESNNDKSVEQFYIDMERWSNHAVQTSTKYRPTRKFVRTHCVVTANTAPDESRLPGRFIIIEAKLPADEEESSEEASADVMDVSEEL